jgi:hypothetical protein
VTTSCYFVSVKKRPTESIIDSFLRQQLCHPEQTMCARVCRTWMCNNQLNKCSLGHITTTKVLLCLFYPRLQLHRRFYPRETCMKIRSGSPMLYTFEAKSPAGVEYSRVLLKKKHASSSGGARVLYFFWPFPSSVAFNQARTGKCFRRETLTHTQSCRNDAAAAEIAALSSKVMWEC